MGVWTRTVISCSALALAALPAAAGARDSVSPVPPPCATAEPAFEFDTPEDAIAFGPPAEISVREFDSGVEVVSSLEVSARTKSGRLIFRENGTENRVWDLRLLHGDGPVTLTLTYDQRTLGADISTACRMTLTKVVRGYRDVRMTGLCDAATRRPRSVIIACGDGNLRIVGIRWSSWDGVAATGRGTVWANDCDPFCAAGTFRKTPVKLYAYRARQLSTDDPYVYTRLRASGRGFRQTYRAVRAPSGAYYWN